MIEDEARKEKEVASLYRNVDVVEEYLEKRMAFSWQKVLHAAQVQCVQSVISRFRPRNVLEIAPGPARIAADLPSHVTGFMVDASREMLQAAEKRLASNGRLQNWHLVEGNAFDLVSQRDLPERFDFVFTFRFIRHFESNERSRLYQSLKGKLGPGGLIMFDVVNRKQREMIEKRNPNPPADALSIYDERYTPESLKAEMKENGFVLKELAPVVRHFRLQSLVSGKLDDVLPRLSRLCVNSLEVFPGNNPLEWVALCEAV